MKGVLLATISFLFASSALGQVYPGYGISGEVNGAGTPATISCTPITDATTGETANAAHVKVAGGTVTISNSEASPLTVQPKASSTAAVVSYFDINGAGKLSTWSGTPTGNGSDKGGIMVPAYRVNHIFNGITTTDTGRWVDTRIYKTAQFIVTCAASGGANSGATLYVSGHADYAGTGSAPSHATHGVDIGSAIVVGVTSNRTTVTGLDNYTKIRIAAQDAATVYVDCVYRVF